ncbi:hypothetical protein RRF57_008833 [Xylaria bambusicola]|uniref:Uncharacterized protein n=1 Tax=Xylaria bambusicola TaxID=326684 RepID=A0AAN7UIK8_9PEZI
MVRKHTQEEESNQSHPKGPYRKEEEKLARAPGEEDRAHQRKEEGTQAEGCDRKRRGGTPMGRPVQS